MKDSLSRLRLPGTQPEFVSHLWRKDMQKTESSQEKVSPKEEGVDDKVEKEVLAPPQPFISDSLLRVFTRDRVRRPHCISFI